jgi:hypothetical protein
MVRESSAPGRALVITGRGSAELLVDWPGFKEMHAWVADRGTNTVGKNWAT